MLVRKCVIIFCFLNEQFIQNPSLILVCVPCHTFSSTNADWKPGVWRHTAGNYYKLVGENYISGTTQGYTVYTVPEEERIAFQPGDKISFRYSSFPLHYDQTSDTHTVRYAGVSLSTDISPGTVYSVASTLTRAYSLKVVFEDEGKCPNLFYLSFMIFLNCLHHQNV